MSRETNSSALPKRTNLKRSTIVKGIYREIDIESSSDPRDSSDSSDPRSEASSSEDDSSSDVVQTVYQPLSQSPPALPVITADTPSISTLPQTLDNAPTDTQREIYPITKKTQTSNLSAMFKPNNDSPPTSSPSQTSISDANATISSIYTKQNDSPATSITIATTPNSTPNPKIQLTSPTSSTIRYKASKPKEFINTTIVRSRRSRPYTTTTRVSFISDSAPNSTPSTTGKSVSSAKKSSIARSLKELRDYNKPAIVRTPEPIKENVKISWTPPYLNDGGSNNNIDESRRYELNHGENKEDNTLNTRNPIRSSQRNRFMNKSVMDFEDQTPERQKRSRKPTIKAAESKIEVNDKQEEPHSPKAKKAKTSLTVETPVSTTNTSTSSTDKKPKAPKSAAKASVKAPRKPSTKSSNSTIKTSDIPTSSSSSSSLSSDPALTLLQQLKSSLINQQKAKDPEFFITNSSNPYSLKQGEILQLISAIKKNDSEWISSFLETLDQQDNKFQHDVYL